VKDFGFQPLLIQYRYELEALTLKHIGKGINNKGKIEEKIANPKELALLPYCITSIV